MYGGTVRRVSLQDINIVNVSMEMEDDDTKNDLYKECFYAEGGFIAKKPTNGNSEMYRGGGDSSSGGAATHSSHRRLQNKRTREQTWSDRTVSNSRGTSLENTSDSSFEKKSKKPKSSVPSSHPCSSSRQTVDASKPPTPSKKTPKDINHDSNITRALIPIGPGFQAQIPDWVAPTKKGKFYGSPGDSDTLRWLGTGVWPTYGLKKIVHYKKVGEGRSDSCSCPSPRSTNCTKQHVREARELLEKELNRGFYTWKFDQMGEVASKSWTPKEEQKFEALVKKNPLSTSEGFWEFASKSFPKRSEKELVSYYQNVYLIKRSRMLANSSADHFDSDDDHYDDFLAV